MNLIGSGLARIVPFRIHKVIAIGRVAQDGMKFGARVSTRPRHKFAVNYVCLRPPWLRVKVPPGTSREVRTPRA